MRIIIGCFFIFSGFEKLTKPYQNFLYVVQSYEIVGKPIDQMVAILFPWVEFVAGVFLVLGLWLRVSLKLVVGLLLAFMITVSQAIIRMLPITSCGCFGESLSLPLPAVLLLDSCLLLTTSMLYRFCEKTARFSLDRYFQK